jgi:hypothetical protein
MHQPGDLSLEIYSNQPGDFYKVSSKPVLTTINLLLIFRTSKSIYMYITTSSTFLILIMLL